MSVMTEAGEVMPIERRANTPFFDLIGSEESYSFAERIADSAWIHGHIPPDAPYADMLRSLTVAVAQSCAESGFICKPELHSGWQTNQPTEFGRSLLAVRGLEDEQKLGATLGVGVDLWERLTISERGAISLHLTQDEAKAAAIKEPDIGLSSWLDITGVVSGGIMRLLSSAAVNGYRWGRGDKVDLWEKIEVMAPRGSDDIYMHIWRQPGMPKTVQPKAIGDTVFKRTRSSAQLERARERVISELLAQTLAGQVDLASS